MLLFPQRTGVYTSIMALCLLCTEVIIGMKLNVLGHYSGYYVVNEVVLLGFYWWILRKIVHKVIDATNITYIFISIHFKFKFFHYFLPYLNIATISITLKINKTLTIYE
jgi:hypothetical protein